MSSTHKRRYKFVSIFSLLFSISEFPFLIFLEIEWKVIYVGSPKDENYDQVIDSFTVGPFAEPGLMQFDIEVLIFK